MLENQLSLNHISHQKKNTKVNFAPKKILKKGDSDEQTVAQTSNIPTKVIDIAKEGTQSAQHSNDDKIISAKKQEEDNISLDSIEIIEQKKSEASVNDEFKSPLKISSSKSSPQKAEKTNRKRSSSNDDYAAESSEEELIVEQLEVMAPRKKQKKQKQLPFPL